jgi:hypothetical protein
MRRSFELNGLAGQPEERREVGWTGRGGPAKPEGVTTSRTLTASVAGGALVEVVSGAATRPFTIAADVEVAAGIASLVAVAAWQRLHPTVPRPIARRPAAPAEVAQARWGFWIAALLLVGGWELFCYADAPRHAHPTLSSLVDTLTVHPVGRGVAFLGWLTFGWYAVTR